MSPTGVIAAITALAKAIPALEGIVKQLVAVITQWSQKRNERVTLERLADKDASVDAAIERARVLPSSVTQQRAAISPTGFPTSSPVGS